MKLIQYVEWTEPNEKEKFIDLIKLSKDDSELKQKIKTTFGIEDYQVFVVLNRFKKLIKKIRSEK